MAAAGSLKKIQAVRTKRKAGSAQQKADPLRSGSWLLTSAFPIPGGEQRAQSTKHRAESTDQILFILAPDF
jgi:hypothetical protein